MADERIVFLLVEDNKHDVLAIKRAWKENRIANKLMVVRDGKEGLDYLYQRGRFSREGDAPRPDVILLNNKLPKMDGMEVLREIRATKEYGSIPVIMFTATENEIEQLKSYDLGVNAYIVKPMKFEKLSRAVRAINNFWNLAEIPEDP